METGWSAWRVARQLGRSRQTNRREDRHIVRNGHVQTAASSGAIQATVATSLSSRTIRRCVAEIHFGKRHPLRLPPLTPTHRRLHLEWCRPRGIWTAAEWKQGVFSDESRFNLSSDDNRIRVWRTRGERLNHAFTL
ncbi:transposable element Tcb2 transposase [Trichonephila clavipes]|nr:transposable element Tcb2 transposase [Trichonephila clavipes]